MKLARFSDIAFVVGFTLTLGGIVYIAVNRADTTKAVAVKNATTIRNIGIAAIAVSGLALLFGKYNKTIA